MNCAAIRSAILVFAACFSSAYLGHAQPASVTIGIVQPAAGSLAGDSLNVVVAAGSTFEIASVTADVAGRQATLVFSSSAYYGSRGQAQPGWVGVLSLSNLARGPLTLTAVATDAFNNSAQAQVTFVHDRKPVLTVIAPLGLTVARPQLHVSASCTDDDPSGCSLTLSVVAGSSQVQIAVGHNDLDQTLSLAAFEGTGITLRFSATDSAGQTVSEDIPIYVESSVRLSEVEIVSGAILDVQPDRILFLEPENDRSVLKVRQRVTGEDSAVMDQAGQFPQYGYLTPKGAIFMEQTGDVLTALIFDERDGSLASLGFPNSAQSLVAKGNYAIWSSGTTLILRDLVAGTNTTIALQAGNWMNDVALDGDVVYWTSGSSYNIFRYQAGITTQLTTDTALWNVYPLTDGSSVIYRKQDPCCGLQRFGLYLNDGLQEVELEPLAQRPEPVTFSDYQINNGWVAFTQLGTGGQLQVWTRSPTGQETQITFFGDSSRISALAPNGQVLFRHGRRYISVQGQQALDIDSGLGKAFWQGTSWWISLGRSLFKVNTAPTPSIRDLFVTTTGQFGFQVSAAEGQTVIIQASADLTEWENLQTNTVAGAGFVFKDDASATVGHRFYRVVAP